MYKVVTMILDDKQLLDFLDEHVGDDDLLAVDVELTPIGGGREEETEQERRLARRGERGVLDRVLLRRGYLTHVEVFE